MALFEKAIETVLMHEGGFSDHAADPGGATRYGISLRFLQQQGHDVDGDGDVNENDIKALSLDTAIDLYREHFWSVNQYEKIMSQDVATKVFDMAVNMGSVRANKILQRSLLSCGLLLKQDGVCGPQTISAINAISSGNLMAALRSESAGYYRLITAKNPAFESFIKGWLNRAYA